MFFRSFKKGDLGKWSRSVARLGGERGGQECRTVAGAKTQTKHSLSKAKGSWESEQSKEVAGGGGCPSSSLYSIVLQNREG